MKDTLTQINELIAAGQPVNGAIMPIPRATIEDKEKAKDLARRVRDFLRHAVPVEDYAIWSFEGYGQDPRALCQVPEVRRFIGFVFNQEPILLRKLMIEPRTLARNCLNIVVSISPVSASQAIFDIEYTPEWMKLARAARIDHETCEDL